MTFSLAGVDRSTEPVRAFEGADLGGLARPELLKLQQLMAAGKQAWDMAMAGVAHEIAARSRVEDGRGGFARQQGFASPESMVATILGTTKAEAERLVKAGRTIAEAESAVQAAAREPGRDEPGSNAPTLRPVAAALKAGWLPVAKANTITDALEPLDCDTLALEAKLVGLAKRLDIYQLRKACRWHADALDPASLADKERKQFEARELTVSEGTNGMVIVTGAFDKVSGATFRTWLDAQVRAAMQAKRKDTSDDRTAAQMRVDALITLIRHGLDCDSPGSGVKSQIVVRVTREELEKELGIAECDALEGPISTATLRHMAVDAAILPIVMDGNSVVLDVGRARRLYTPQQSIALGERDGGCAYCHAPRSYCATHHIRYWRHGGRTDMSNGVLLCTQHHNMVHYDRWDIRVDERNRVWFIPPAALDPERTPRLGGRAALTDPV